MPSEAPTTISEEFRHVWLHELRGWHVTVITEYRTFSAYMWYEFYDERRVRFCNPGLDTWVPSTRVIGIDPATRTITVEGRLFDV